MELVGYASDSEMGFLFQNETRSCTCSFFPYRVIDRKLEGLGFSKSEEVGL